jgi:hypothetical protein
VKQVTVDNNQLVLLQLVSGVFVLGRALVRNPVVAGIDQQTYTDDEALPVTTPVQINLMMDPRTNQTHIGLGSYFPPICSEFSDRDAVAEIPISHITHVLTANTEMEQNYVKATSRIQVVSGNGGIHL